MKAWYGANATAENNWSTTTCRSSTFPTTTCCKVFDLMGQGKVNGYMCQGFNPIAALPDKNRVMAALAKLKWLVVMDPLATETSEFWRNVGPFNDVKSAEIQTEVIRLPTTCFAEEDGSLVNSSRWLQWHWKGADGPGEAQTDIRIMSELFLRLRNAIRPRRQPPTRCSNCPGPTRSPTNLRRKNWPRKSTAAPPPTSPMPLARRSRPVPNWRRSPAQGRRQHRVRLLDLRRQLDRGGQPDGPPRQRRPVWHASTSGLGLGLAGQPADSLQPRLGRRAANRGIRKTPGVVERQGLGRHRRAGLQGRCAAGSRDEPVHHEPRRRGAVLRRRQDERGPFPEHYEPFETPIGINPLHPQNKKATSNPAARIFDSVWEPSAKDSRTPPPATG
jgi:formate dehydrogenase major subunit